MYPDNWEVVYPAKKFKRIHHFSSVLECANIPGRVTINDLPSELVVNIIRHVTNSIINSGYVGCSHRDDIDSSIRKDFPLYNSRSLLQLALCSRYLHRLVEPIIYERFHYNAQAPAKGFLLFLKQILARPDLGEWIRVFHVDGTQAPGLGMVIDEEQNILEFYTDNNKDDYKSDFDLCCFTAEDLKAVRKKIAEAGTTTGECYEWAMGVEKGDLNAMIALMLTLTPNLQVLDIDMWTHPYPLPSILTRMLDHTGRLQRERQLGNPLALWSLKEVVVRYYCNTYLEKTVHHLMSLLMIPSVEILCTIDQNAIMTDGYPSVETDVDAERLAADFGGNNLKLANMKELSLLYTIIRPNALFQLLRCYPNLKRFYHEDGLGPQFDSSIEINDFKNNNLMAIASCRSPQLENLTILSWGYIWGSIMTLSISSLEPLKNLRYLETTWPIFTGRGDIDEETGSFPSSQSIVDAIPLRLERLCILGGPDDNAGRDSALAVIFMFLQQKHRFPALKILDFGWKHRPYPNPDPNKPKLWDSYYYHEGFTKEDYEKIIARCQGAGVELVLKPVKPARPKYIYYCVDDDGNRTASGENEVQRIVHYPYDDYERICSENGCDLKTGRPDDWAMRSQD